MGLLTVQCTTLAQKLVHSVYEILCKVMVQKINLNKLLKYALEIKQDTITVLQSNKFSLIMLYYDVFCVEFSFILDEHEHITLYTIFNKFNLSKYPSKSKEI